MNEQHRICVRIFTFVLIEMRAWFSGPPGAIRGGPAPNETKNVSALEISRKDRDSELKLASFGDASGKQIASSRMSEPRGSMAIWRQYAVTTVCVIVAFLVRYLLRPFLGEELPFMMFIAATLVAAWYGGAGCGMAALALGLFLADCVFLPSGKAPQPVETVRLVRYVVTACLGIGLIELLHRTNRRTEAMVEELSREVERRKKSERQLVEAETQLSQHAQELERRVWDQTSKLADTVESLRNLLYFIAHNLRAPLLQDNGVGIDPQFQEKIFAAF